MLSRFNTSRFLLRSFSSPSSRIVSAVNENRIVTVKWEDGKIGEFPVIWLRDTSPDVKTYSVGPAMKARNLTMNTFDVRQSPVSMNVVNNELIVEWPGDVHSKFTSAWLRFRNPSCEEGRKRRRDVYLFPANTWGSKEMENGPKKFDHNAVLTEDKACHDFLEAVCLDGIAIASRAPKGERGAVEAIGERIGLIHNTHFGKVFEVAKKSDASNMAYASSGGLPFHTDFPSLSHPPQLQLLHMLTKAVEGGNSLFVDGFHVAEQLRVERPDVFEILSKYNMEFIEEGFDIHDGPDGKPKTFTFDMCARHKVIKLDETGKVIKIQFGNAMRSWFYDCEPRKIQEIYDAMKVFTDYCYQDRNVLKFALEEGDTVLWANTRLLHTRDAYVDAPDRIRTLTGCYFAWDIVKSRVRVLRDNLKLPQNQPSI